MRTTPMMIAADRHAAGFQQQGWSSATRVPPYANQSALRAFTRTISADQRGVRSESDFDIAKRPEIFDARTLKLHWFLP